MKLPITETPIQIRFSDLDILGHVSNGIYSQYLEVGRIDWFKSLDTTWPDCVVAHISIDYVREINLSDDVYVRTSCIKKGTKSITVSQDVYANGILATKANTVLVGFDTNTRKSCNLLDGWEPSE